MKSSRRRSSRSQIVAFSLQMPRKTDARRRSYSTKRLAVEALERRHLLATLFVDNPGDFDITTDTGAAGLSAGDTVTWNPGAGSQHGAAVTGLTFGTNAFSTIQSAVNAASAGDTIRVGPGTFVEGVNVNKQLTLLGNQFGVDAQGGRSGAAETIVTGVGNNGVTPFSLTASDVELNGFTIEGASNANVFGFGILLGTGTSGSKITDNLVQNNIAGLSLANSSTTDQTQITGNLFQNNNVAGPVSGTAIYTDQFNAGGALNDVLIDNNTFANNQNAAVIIGPTAAASPATNITISRNIMTGNGNAVLLFNTLNSTITQNEISGSTASQVIIGGGDNGIAITQNFVTGGATRGIRIGDFGGGGTNQNVTINRNSISGNPTAGLEIDSTAGAYTGALNAEFNWWGSASGPTIASNPGGTGDIIIDANNQVDYTPFLPNGVDTQPAVRGFQPSIADLAITKNDTPDPVVPGTTLTYTIIVTNNGPDTQTGATVADTLPALLTGVVFTSTATGGATGNTASGSTSINDTVTMPSGSTITYTVTGTVPPSAAGSLSNTATVTAPANTFETNTANNSATATTTIAPGQADLSIAKSDTPDPVTAGQNLTYNITINTAGPSDAQNVMLTDTLPAGTTFVSLTGPAGWSNTTPAVGGTGTITSTRPTLAAGTAAQAFALVVHVNSTVPGDSTLSNSAAVSSTTTDTVPTNNNDTETTTVNTSADVSVTKDDSPDPVTAGNNLTYTIVVNSSGPSDAQNLVLSDALPPNTTFVSLTGPAGWSNTTPTVGATGTVTSTRGTLAAGSGPQTFVLIVKVDASAEPETILTNTATVTSTTTDANAVNNTSTETTTVNTAADLSVTKTDSQDPVNPGDSITYTIIVSNSGASDAQDVSLTDGIPANTTFVSASQIAGPTFTLTAPPAGGTGAVTATTPTLAAGASATFSIVVQVASTAAGGSTISNTATVASTTIDTNTANNTATQTTDVGQPQNPLECSVTTLNEPGNFGTSAIGDDADNPGSGVLVVTGTNRNDIIVVEPKPGNSSRIRVTFNGRQTAAFNRSDVQHIVVFGLSGNDMLIVNGSLSIPATLFGGSGNDQLFGGRGNDGLDGGDGNDSLFGGNGNDTLCGGNGNDFASGGAGNDTVGGDAGNDRLFGDGGNDLVLGGDGNDNLYGGAGNDQLFGQAGNDQLFGDSGNDILLGGIGNDKLYGDGGRDLLIGGEGHDQLFGEDSDDILVAGSTIHDEDQEALSAILAEWTSGRNYITRVNNIRFGGGANGGFTLDDATVIDDGQGDILRGDGSLDWFLIGGGDKIKDRSRNEQVN